MIPQTDTFSEGEPLRLTASSKIGEYASNICQTYGIYSLFWGEGVVTQ
jgi:hypothetical protein